MKKKNILNRNHEIEHVTKGQIKVNYCLKDLISSVRQKDVTIASKRKKKKKDVTISLIRSSKGETEETFGNISIKLLLFFRGRYI